ncbi:hypothetical protein SKAU_G00347960 [Synaphobranchus kaupii]|uniref:Uncharacterized protein n=1 Tax=Synaphobranchus kaupii TaxID=118154 RepID=A0A9Q1EJX2_SYNKA|nr:hypothetical protein SKAU_G00347960 [Synaphobranchus kaupii]
MGKRRLFVPLQTPCSPAADWGPWRVWSRGIGFQQKVMRDCVCGQSRGGVQALLCVSMFSPKVVTVEEESKQDRG